MDEDASLREGRGVVCVGDRWTPVSLSGGGGDDDDDISMLVRGITSELSSFTVEQTAFSDFGTLAQFNVKSFWRKLDALSTASDEGHCVMRLNSDPAIRSVGSLLGNFSASLADSCSEFEVRSSSSKIDVLELFTLSWKRLSDRTMMSISDRFVGPEIVLNLKRRALLVELLMLEP